jgi:hypothetical protein
VARGIPVAFFFRQLAKPCVAVLGLVFIFCSTGYAQGGVPLVTVATDQTSLDLSNQFGVPAATAINQNGDFTFVGHGDTALFLRAAGAASATRALQTGDAVPGVSGSRISYFWPTVALNASRLLLFEAIYDLGDGEFRESLMTYDGANFKILVSSDDIAPGSGGATYGGSLRIGGINDHGDVSFSTLALNTTITSTGTQVTEVSTFYILPSGATTAVRVAGTNDPPPPACTWCSVPTGPSIPGNPFALFAPPINSAGQILISFAGGLFIGSKDGLIVVPLASSGSCGPPATPSTSGGFFGGTPTSSVLVSSTPAAFLNNAGAVAFMDLTASAGVSTTAICIAPAGGAPPTVAVASASSAPTSLGGTIKSPFPLGFDDSGDITFQSLISGSGVTALALLRYHQSNGLIDVIAYEGEVAPGTNGLYFSTLAGGAVITTIDPSEFSGVSTANDGSVSFRAVLPNNQSGVYRQSLGNLPELIFLDQEPSGVLAGGSPFFPSIFATKILDNDSTFYSTYLTGGAADFAVYLGTPGNIQSLISTADLLPSGAVTILGSTPPQAAGHFVAFTAQPAAGRVNLLMSDLTSGVITRVTSDNDPGFATAGGTPGNTVLAPNYFLNESGQVAFEAVEANELFGFRSIISFGGSGSVNTAWLSGAIPNCGTIYLWSPSVGLTKVVAAGDTAPNSTFKFSCVTLNSGPPSPLNRSGQLVFSGPSPFGPPVPCSLCGGPPQLGVNGVFLYSPGGTISEIAAANDTLPGQTQSTTFVPYLSVPVNSQGQVAFGAELGTSSQGFYLRSVDATQKVTTNGDAVPGTSDSFGFPHFIAGLSESGNLAFTAATSAAADGLFSAPAGGSIQTLALDGGAAPGTSGGTFTLTSPAPVTPPGTFPVGISFFKNFAAINAESDVAFGAAITGGSADSGYFRVLQSGPAAGTPQPVVLQGQTTPAGGTFNTITSPGNLLSDLGSDFALGPDGDLAFMNAFSSDSGARRGMFVARADGALVKVAATGDFVPGGGLLTSLSMSPKLAAGDAGKFAFLAGIAGGSAREAIFVTAIPPGTAGTTVALNPLQGLVVAPQSVTLTATVTGTTSGTPTGTVTFFDNGISLGTGTLNSSGQATLTTSSLVAGPDSIDAQYDGDPHFASGNSNALTEVVVGFGPPPGQLAFTPGQRLVIPLTLYAPSASNLSFMLSCSGLPANTACSFDQNPVTPAERGTTVQLTLRSGNGSKLPAPRHRNPLPLAGAGLTALLAALAAAAMIFSRRTPQWQLVSCACLAAFALALVMAGCGAVGTNSNASSGPPPGATQFTVTGTSGGTTISTVVRVTVQ